MARNKHFVDKTSPVNFPKLVMAAIFFAACVPGYSLAQQKSQKTFSSAEQAVSALVTAAQNNDESAMLEVLGKDAKRIVASGDEAEDAEARSNFVKRYQEMHRLVSEPDGSTTLYIGAENWPAPIPLLNKGNTWYFDTDSAWREIVYRRVGRNELSTVRVCQELVAAEKEYASMQQNEYAWKSASEEGKHDGLYWKAEPGQPNSPIGPLVAAAIVESDAKAPGTAPTPFMGYYFRVLKQQGKDAPGGAKRFLVDGKMTGGFAFVAYPAEYRSSGVMTFLVGTDGVVYQKDFGKKTAMRAKSLKEYDPDPSWQKAEEPEDDKTASGQKPM